MTILREIQKWAEKLPAWQQHAVAVLYERPTPTADDLEDMRLENKDMSGSEKRRNAATPEFCDYIAR